MEPTETVKMGMTISDGLMIFAVILGPILAVQIQKLIESKSAKKKHREKIFQDLMSTRASTLSLNHVSALNMVGIAFNEKKFSKVNNAWVTYLDHLNSYPEGDEVLSKGWGEKRNDLLSDLLYEMGISLNFEFDKVHIKKAGYFPKALADREWNSDVIRSELAKILCGQKSIPMDVMSMPVDSDAFETQKELHSLMKEHFAGERSISVKLTDSHETKPE